MPNPLLILGAIGLGGLAVYALSKPKPPQAGFGAQGSIQGNVPLMNLPNPMIPKPATGVPSPAITISDGNGGKIVVPADIPVSVNAEAYMVNTVTDPLLLRSGPVIQGQAVGQGNVIGAIPKGGIVTRLPGTQDSNGFRNVRTLEGATGWAYAAYLQSVANAVGLGA